VGLLLCFLAHTVSLSALQRAAPYHAGFSYGDRGQEEVAALIRQTVPADLRVVATRDIVFQSGRHEYFDDAVWNDLDRFLEAAGDARTGAVVYSLGHNTAGQYQSVLRHPRALEALANDFEELEVGTFTVLRRTPRSTP
jgi:hypothetical protein